MWETQVQSLGWENSLEKEMATHSSTLARKIPWMEEPGRLQSMGSQSQIQLNNFTLYLWRTVGKFLKKLKIELPYDPMVCHHCCDTKAIPLLGIYLGKIIIWKDTYTTVFTGELFITVRLWENWKQGTWNISKGKKKYFPPKRTLHQKFESKQFIWEKTAEGTL